MRKYMLFTLLVIACNPQEAKQTTQQTDMAFTIPQEARCPVCAMQSSKYPKHAAIMKLTNGTKKYFCGTGCALKSWAASDYYLKIPQSEIKSMHVINYFTGKYMNAEAAHFITGSDVPGPMGKAIIALSSDKEVQSFKKRHGAQHIFTLHELNPQTWQTYTGKLLMPHLQK